MQNNEINLSKKNRIIPIQKWSEYHQWPSEDDLRGFIDRKKFNGFDKVMVKVGKRILIDEDKLFEWIGSFKNHNPIDYFGTWSPISGHEMVEMYNKISEIYSRFTL